MESWLPALNAGFNATTFALLLAGYAAIRRGRRQLHLRLMLSALGTASLFLVGYLTRLTLGGVHRFPPVAGWRSIYLVVLGSHTLLAAVSLPLIVTGLVWAVRGDFERHRRTMRWAWPVWLYVSFTGVVVYLMLYQLAPRLSP